MWSISELKRKAKIDFKPCYWKAVLASFIIGIATSGSGGSSANSAQNANQDAANIGDMGQAIAIFMAIMMAVLLAVAITIVVKIFVLNPLGIGAYRFFLLNTEASEHDQDMAVITHGFRNNYKNTVLVVFMKNLFVFLWSLLFIIPGIVKAYQYRMVEYIIGENPDISYQDALALSKQMMDGNKGKAFLLDLSFIGWYILCALTLGILALFYVGPYVQFTNAELYQTLKEQ